MQEYDLFLANDTYDVQKNSNFANCLNNLGWQYISIFIRECKVNCVRLQ